MHLGSLRLVCKPYSHFPKRSQTHYDYTSLLLLQNQTKSTVYHDTGTKTSQFCPQHCYFSQFVIPSPTLLIQEILPFPSGVRLVVAEGLLQLTNGLSTCRIQLQINVLSWKDENTNKSNQINHNQKNPNPWQPRRKLIVVAFICRM